MNRPNGITFEQVNQLYTDSKFLYDQKRTLLDPYWNEICSTWGKLLVADPNVFQFHYQVRDGKPSSSICRVLYCDRTWMVQHAVSLKDPSGLLRNMLDAVDWATSSHRCDFVRILYRPSNPWPRNVFGTIAPHLVDNSSEYHVYDYYSGSCNAPAPLVDRPGLTTDYLCASDYPELMSLLYENHSKLFVESKGLNRTEFGMMDTSYRYAAAGLQRERFLLVAKQYDQILGYSLIEFSSLGINLSLLLNSFSVKMFTEDHLAEHNLVASSINHYLRCGRNFVVALCENSNKSIFSSLGLETSKQYEELSFSSGENMLLVIEHLKGCYGHKPEVLSSTPTVPRPSSSIVRAIL